MLMLLSTTERLTIRHLSVNDHEFVFTLLNDESFIKNIGDKEIRNSDDAINYLVNGPIASYKEHGFGLNLVCLKNNNTPIGMCGFLKRPGFDYVEIGYALLPEYCSKGFAEEATRSVLIVGHEHNHAEEVFALTMLENYRSNLLLEKLGFTLQNKIEFSGALNNLYKVKLASFIEN
jgi:RimJ/RimL family protein N-acetyltransferase